MRSFDGTIAISKKKLSNSQFWDTSMPMLCRCNDLGLISYRDYARVILKKKAWNARDDFFHNIHRHIGTVFGGIDSEVNYVLW